MFDSLNDDCSSEYIGFAMAAVITILYGSFKIFKNLKTIGWTRLEYFQNDLGKSEPRTEGYK